MIYLGLTMTEYWRIHLPESLKEAISEIFAKDRILGLAYNDNEVNFVKDAVRKQILYYAKILDQSKSSNDSKDSKLD